MQFALVFAVTGNHIILDSLQDDVLSFFIKSLDRAGRNEFVSIDDFVNTTYRNILALRSAVQTILDWPQEIRPSWLQSLDVTDCFDQILLNEIHANWVSSLTEPWDIKQKKRLHNTELVASISDQFPDDIMKPPLGVVLDKLCLLNTYGLINSHLHQMESSFDRMRFGQQSGWTEFENPFGRSITSNDIAHLSIAFNHLGRSFYDKWLYFDSDLRTQDENTFREILPFVDIRLTRNQSCGYSVQYQEWCKNNQLQPSGTRICLGNIPDLEKNLPYYRAMMFNNLAQGNSFSIQLA
jgi:hypothetical protein